MHSPNTSLMEIVVNGETRTAPEGVDLRTLLERLEIEPSRVAVELNREIVSKALWNTTTIRSGDRLEIVQFVGGG